MRAFVAAGLSFGLCFAAASASAQSRQISQTTVGPWAVNGWINSADAPYCSAERKFGDTTVVFARFVEGYGLALQSPNWWLTPGVAVPVQVAAASGADGTVQGQVLSSNLVLARLTTDPAVMRRISELPQIVVTVSNEAITITLEQFGDALTALDDCLAKGRQPSAPPPSASPGEPAPQPAQAPATPGNIPTVVPMTISGLIETVRSA